MNRKIIFAPDEFYHIYNRGNDKREIFLNKKDYRRFICLLYLCNSYKPLHFRDILKGSEFLFDQDETLVDIGCYCLMPNHFHILVKEKDDGNLPLFMQKLATGYSMYFNLKQKRTGKLFEGVFKATHADSDEYLKYLFAYIHLNPIKLIEPLWKETGIKNLKQASAFLKNYQPSSYLDFQETKREEAKILNLKDFPEYFSDKKDFNDYINDWLNYREFTD